MAESVGVVIPVTGDLERWIPLAERAMESVIRQTRAPDRAIIFVGDSLQRARNGGAEELEVDWLIFLDADDELDSKYVEEMLAVSAGDIRRPATRGVYADGTEEEPPSMIPVRDIREANYIVIGAMVRRDLFLDAGGFSDLPILEDWDLWRRLVLKHDASVVEVPAAVYRVHVTPESRNQDPSHNQVYRQIRKS